MYNQPESEITSLEQLEAQSDRRFQFLAKAILAGSSNSLSLDAEQFTNPEFRMLTSVGFTWDSETGRLVHSREFLALVKIGEIFILSEQYADSGKFRYRTNDFLKLLMWLADANVYS